MSRTLPLAAESDLGLGVSDDSSSRLKRNETMWLSFAPTGVSVAFAANCGTENVGASCWSTCEGESRSFGLFLLDACSGAASKDLFAGAVIKIGLSG